MSVVLFLNNPSKREEGLVGIQNTFGTLKLTVHDVPTAELPDSSLIACELCPLTKYFQYSEVLYVWNN